MLFKRGSIGTLDLANRIVRSATAEHMADEQGRPRAQLKELYSQLAQGGVGLIITGHMYIHPGGKAHTEMTGIYGDELLPGLAELAEAVHEQGGKIAAQINHGGMQCDEEVVPEAIAPSAIEAPWSERAARAMSASEIDFLIEAYGEAAGRVKQAGFDGIQIHAAHGYLISQFLSPLTNKRQDKWGGDLERRMNFLRSVCQAVREQVGPDFPMMIKLGMVDGVEGGLSANEAVRVVAELEGMGLDGLEISGGISGFAEIIIRKDVRAEADEAYFRPLAAKARAATNLPILLVGGLRSRKVMEEVLASGEADFISLSRPLISEPELPNLMRLELQDASRCISANECWPDELGEGISCKCPVD